MSSDEKTILIDNPSGLPLIPLEQIKDFQADLKKNADAKTFRKLVDSILKHHLFIAKAIFYENGEIYTEDGHQTLKALRYLVSAGYVGCDVITYKLVRGEMKEAGRKHYDEIMIPCQTIVPVGKTRHDRMKDAAEKLLQINSRYAEFNPKTTWFAQLDISTAEVDEMLKSLSIAELVNAAKSDFDQEFDEVTDADVPMPLVPKFGENYAALVIIMKNDTEIGFVKTALKVRPEQTYIQQTPKGAKVKEGMVIDAARFAEMWKKRGK